MTPYRAYKQGYTMTLEELAKECYDTNDGDILKATNEFENKVRADDVLFRTALEPLVRQACYSIISGIMRTERKAVWNGAGVKATAKPIYTTPVHRPDNAIRVAALATGTLMMFPLMGGVRLRDATRQQVSDTAQMYADKASDMAWKSRWLGLVAAKMGDDETKKVVDIISESELNELKAEAEES